MIEDITWPRGDTKFLFASLTREIFFNTKTFLCAFISPMLPPQEQEKLIAEQASCLKLVSLVNRSLSAFCLYRRRSLIETHFSSFYSIAACKEKPLVSRVHPPGICLNRFLYLLPIIFFRDLQRAWLRFRWLMWGRQYLNRL